MKFLVLGLRSLIVAVLMLLLPSFTSVEMSCVQASSSDILVGMGIDEERYVYVGDEFSVDIGRQVLYKTNNHDTTDLVQSEDGKFRVKFTRTGDAVISCLFPNKTNNGSVSLEVMNILFHISSTEDSQKSYGNESLSNSNEQGANENFAQEILALVNKERSKAGVRPLVLDYELMEGCKLRARELPQSYSHTRPDGRDCFTVISFHNAYKGENIAAGYGNSEQAMEGWMNSPGHRANILDRNYVKLGVGYYYDPNSTYQYYWVQMFMGRDV